MLICETKEEARQRFVAWRNALENKGLKVNVSKIKCMVCCAKGGSSRPVQCVWKESGCEFNTMCNMWLLGAWAMFGSTGTFGESGTGFCVQNVQR